DLHAAVRAEVIAVRQRRASRAALEGVADEAAPAGIGAVDPEPQAALADVAVEIEVADAGLDERVREILVDLDDLVHALQVEHDAAGVDGRRAAVGEVAAGRDR